MNYVALKPVKFCGRQYKVGEIVPEGIVDERRSLFLKKSGHIAEAASVNGANTENLSVNPNTLSIPLLQSKHELVMNAQQLSQFFATIQKTIDEAKIEIATMTEEDVLSMGFEGPLYALINYPQGTGDYRKLDEFNQIFKNYGLYYELGDAWNLSCYYI